MLVVYSEIILVNRRGIIDRVPECLSLRRNWVPPPPPPSSVTPPPGPKWEGDTLAYGGGGGGPNSEEGTDTSVQLQ
jgi:hypothetical protein